MFLKVGVSEILLLVREGGQSFEGRRDTAIRAWGTTGRPGGALESITARDTTGRERYRFHQCVRYHQPKEHEESAKKPRK